MSNDPQHKNMPARIAKLSIYTITAFFSASLSSCMATSPIQIEAIAHQQTAVDEAIDKALDDEIAETALKEYYYGKDKDGLLHCVHQQTHRKESAVDGSVIVYANVICGKHHAGEESYKTLETIPRVPIKIELEKIEGSFSVLEYRSHNQLLGERSFRSVFPPQLIDEIGNSQTRQSTYNKLRLKMGR